MPKVKTVAVPRSARPCANRRRHECGNPQCPTIGGRCSGAVRSGTISHCNFNCGAFHRGERKGKHSTALRDSSRFAELPQDLAGLPEPPKQECRLDIARSGHGRRPGPGLPVPCSAVGCVTHRAVEQRQADRPLFRLPGECPLERAGEGHRQTAGADAGEVRRPLRHKGSGHA